MPKGKIFNWRDAIPAPPPRKPARVMLATPIGRDNFVTISVVGREKIYQEDFDIVIEHLRWYQRTLNRDTEHDTATE